MRRSNEDLEEDPLFLSADLTTVHGPTRQAALGKEGLRESEGEAAVAVSETTIDWGPPLARGEVAARGVRASSARALSRLRFERAEESGGGVRE